MYYIIETKVDITREQQEALRAAQASAAKGFWAHPGQEWQEEFQRDWLLEHVGCSAGRGPDGLVWGTQP